MSCASISRPSARRWRKKGLRDQYAGLISLEEEEATAGAWLKHFADDFNELVYRKTGVLLRKMSRGAFLIAKYTDQHGDVATAFRTLQIQPEDQLNWLEFWFALDVNDDNRMEYNEFLSSFGLKDHLYTRRFFDAINLSLTGFVCFKEFVTQVWDFLVEDRELTLQLGFRLLSSLGTRFELGRSTLTSEDLRTFLELRYPSLQPRARERRAKALYYRINGAGLEGIDYETFRRFCYDDPILLVYAVGTQHAVRRRLFGERYWEELTASRSPPYTIDVVLQRRFKDLIKSEADMTKAKLKADFDKEFPSIARKFKQSRLSKEKRDVLNTETSWTLAQQTRDRVTQLLEDTTGSGNRYTLRKRFKRWRKNAQAVADAEKKKVAESEALREESPAEALSAGKRFAGFFSFGRKRAKILSSNSQGNSPQQATPTKSEKNLRRSFFSMSPRSPKEGPTDISGTKGSGELSPPRRRSAAMRYMSITSRLGSSIEIGPQGDTIHAKILERQAKATPTPQALYDSFKEAYMVRLHRDPSQAFSLTDIAHEQWLLARTATVDSDDPRDYCRTGSTDHAERQERSLVLIK